MQNNIAWQKMDSIISLKNVGNQYLFYEQISQIQNCCNSIVNSTQDMRHESIIGIVGERGSGKSSLLHTAKENLNDFFVLDVLDPNVFDDSMSILELFVSQIHKCVLEFSNIEDDIFDAVVLQLHQQLKDIIKLLSDYQGGKKNFYQNYSYGDLLENIMQRVNMPVLINKLVKNFLELAETKRKAKFKGLVLCIDDVDLVSNDKVYSLLEDVRKYLAGNVIVITAYRSMQLFDSVLNEKLKENQQLIDSKSLSENDVRDQVSRYLEKLIPVHNRVHLYAAEDLLQKPYYQLFTDMMEYDLPDANAVLGELHKIFGERHLPVDGNMTMRQWLYEALNLRLRIKLSPVDQWENTLYNLPVNLRGLLQLVQLIVCRMGDIKLFEKKQDDNGLLRVEICDAILNNISYYKEYFNQGLSEILPFELSNIIYLWRKSEYRAKNYLICDVLINKIQKIDGSVLINLPRYNLFQVYNISIGDVYSVIEAFKSVVGVDDKYRYFVYALKVLYSFELLTNYLHACKNHIRQTSEGTDDVNYELEVYLNLINAKIISNNFKYFTRSLWTGKIIYNNTEQEILGNLLYSTVALESDIRDSIPIYNYDNNGLKIGQTKAQSLKYATLKYKKLYEYDIGGNLSEFVANTQYPIDPYAFLGQKKYVQSTFTSKKYVFYSFFDIDAFIKFDYGRGSETREIDRLEHLLYKVEGIITKRKMPKFPIEKSYEFELQRNMSDIIFYVNSLDNKDDDEYIEAIYAVAPDNTINLSNIQLNKGNTDLPKSKFINLIKKILKELSVTKEESEQLEKISDRLEGSKAMVRKIEKDILTRITEKYNYSFDEESL